MIYALIGTNSQLRKQFKSEFKKSHGNIDLYIEGNLNTLIDNIYSQSILDSKPLVISVTGFLKLEEYRSQLYRLLPELVISRNIFVIDELEAETATVNKLIKEGVKVTDARESVADYNPFPYVESFMIRDRRDAWLKFLELEGEVPEAIHGALLWKVKNTLNGNVKWTKQDVQKLYFEMLEAYHESHRGNINLKLWLERKTLEI